MTDPAPKAPGLGELFELSLTAIVDPSVFRRAAVRPAPSFGASGGLALICGAAAMGVNLAHAAIATPGFLGQFSPPVLAAVGLAALGLYGSVLLLIAVLFYAIANSSGGKGEFERALQAVAMISVLAPVQMMCSWFPVAWLAPALVAGWVGACALEGLFNARPGPARVFCAALAAVALGLQAAVGVLTDRARDAFAATQAVKETAEANAELARSMSAFNQQAQALTAAASATSAPPAASSLDLLRGGPSEGDGSAAAGPEPAGSQQLANSAPNASGIQVINPESASAAQAMQANAAGMLDAMTPMLNMLMASKTMKPDQKADLKELEGLMQELKTQMVSGKRMDNAVFAQKMARYQTLLMKVMAYSSQAAAASPAAPASPASNQQIHLKLPQDGR